jgi:hypothetical protein
MKPINLIITFLLILEFYNARKQIYEIIIIINSNVPGDSFHAILCLR